MIIYKFLVLASPQVSVSHLLALSRFPLKISDISFEYINRLGLSYLEPLVFTGTHLQHVFFFQDAHPATAAHPPCQKKPLNSGHWIFCSWMLLSFYSCSVYDISASPWASNASDAAQQILVHNELGNRFSWWWRCNMIGSQNVLVSALWSTSCMTAVCSFLYEECWMMWVAFCLLQKSRVATTKQVTCTDYC